MIKKTPAALIALIMCIGLAGCGIVGNSRKGSVKAETSNAQNDTYTTDGEDGAGIMILNSLRPENIVYKGCSDYDINKPTMKEALMFADLAVEQYSAAQSGDAEKFKQTFNFEKVFDAIADSMYISGFVDNSRDDIESSIAFSYEFMLELAAGEDMLMDMEIAKRSSAEECEKLLKQAYENFDPNSLDTSIWAQKDSLYPLGDIDDKTIVRIFLNDFQRDDNALEMYIDIDVINDGHRISLTNIDAWRIDSDIGVSIGDAECEINEFTGMTAEEVDQYITHENNEYAAKSIYDFVSDYLTPKSANDEDAKTVIETEFPMCSSSSGLDLRGNEPEAAGDSWIYDILTITNGIDGKVVSFGPLDEEKGIPEYVIYTSADGTVTKYPDNRKD